MLPHKKSDEKGGIMEQEGYLSWVINNTRSKWWHDSADPVELKRGLERGAVGVTTNPCLSNLSLSQNRQKWANEIQNVLSHNLEPESSAEALMKIVVTFVAQQLMPEYDRSGQEMGYVCAQVNPARAGNRKVMLPMARRFHAWSPNIAVKLPATAAGLDVLEDCTAEGITATLTVSFTVPQAIAIAERHRRGIARAKKNGVEPGRCFAVIMIGRLDDYLRDVAHDFQAAISEADIRQAGLAVTKRVYSIYTQREYEAVLIVAALRGTYHVTELAGAEIVISIAPPYQQMLLSKDISHEQRIQEEVPSDVIERLCTLPEFVRAYDPEGMSPKDFITYGVTQRTLTQFSEVGWKLLERFKSA
jgi:transaldolase